MRCKAAPCQRNDWDYFPLALCHSYLHDNFANHVTAAVAVIILVIMLMKQTRLLFIKLVVMMIMLLIMKHLLHVHDAVLTTALHFCTTQILITQVQSHTVNLINAHHKAVTIPVMVKQRRQKLKLLGTVMVAKL